MAKSRSRFESPYIDLDFEPFRIDEVRTFLEAEAIDCNRPAPKHVYFADAATQEATVAERVSSLAEAVTHRLNIAAKAFKITAAEAMRPTAKDTARQLQDAHKAGRKLTRLVFGKIGADGKATVHPAIRRKLEEVRAARRQQRNPHLSLDSDLQAFLRLAADIAAAHEELGTPEAVDETTPSRALDALDGFVLALQRTWEEAIGRRAATSVGAVTDPRNSGKATGPFVRFMAWCVHKLPGHEDETPHALRNRFRRLRLEQAGKQA